VQNRFHHIGEMLRVRQIALGLAAAGLAGVLLPTNLLNAQTDTARGELRGTVTDPSGAVVPLARLTLKSGDTGFLRQNTTGDSGDYTFLAVPPGDYDVQIEKDLFQPELLHGVHISVGQVTTLDAQLKLGTVKETLVINGAAALLEIERSQQANIVAQESIAKLPIDRRDYLTFALLSPGVVDSTGQANDTDLRLKQVPTSGISFFGSNGRGNSVTIDGGEANDGGGGVRSTLSQEAIEEFQINRSNYSAEQGGASGGTINIVSRAGSNDLRGSLFGFFRHDALDAGNPFARVLEGTQLVRTKPPSKRQQFGGSIGGPIRKDRTFVFAAFEGLVRRESSVVSILTDTSIFDPTPAQNAVLNTLPAAEAASLRSALTASPETRALFEKNSGVFPFSSDVWRSSVRLDHRLTERDQLFFRGSFSKLNETNANLEALIGASRGLETQQLDPTLAVGWTRVGSPRFVNEAHIQWGYRRFYVDSVDKFGPELRISGYGVFNEDYLLPSRNIERRAEIRDDLTWIRGSHTVKFGVQSLIRGTHSESHIFFSGRFTFGDLPGFLLDPNLPATFTINALQAFNLGLAQTYIQGAGNPTVASTNPYYGFYIQDGWKIRPGLRLDFGLRYELDTRQPPLPTAKKNFAPRFALAWNPQRSQKTVVRAGYGIYYSPIYYQIDWSVNALNQINGFRQIGQAFTSILTPGAASAANIFTTLRQEGVIGIPTPTRSITPADVAPFGITFPQTGPLPPFAILFQNSPDFTNPYSQQGSISIEHQFAQDLAISAGYTWVRTLKLTRARDANLLPAPVDPQLGIPVWSDPKYFVNPLVAQLNVFESTANAYYNAFMVQLTKRFSRKFSFNANYTLSKATDDVTDFNSDFEAADQTNLRAERARSSFDQRHKFVAYAVWSAPGKLELSPIVRANSGRPFNLLVGADLNQDRHDTTDRPPGAGRNTGVGPAFAAVDLRISREFNLGEHRRLQLTAEAFNLLNHLNMASVNNVVGLMAGPFDVTGRNDRLPTQPLGFTSAYDPRRIQLGARFSF